MEFTQGETAIARIDADATRKAQEATTLVAIANSFECTTRAGFLDGAEQLRRIAGMRNKLEEKRVAVTGPLNTAIRELNSWFKGPLEALDSAKRKLGDTMGRFEQQEREAEQKAKREAQAKAQAEAEELARRAQAAEAKGKHERASELLERATSVVAKPVDMIAPKAAGVSFTERWEFEVVNMDKIPREYLVPDLAKIGQVVRALKNKAGAEATIPGICVTSVMGNSVRTKR